MPLFRKTVRGECKFCQQLALECTKLKVGIFWEIDTLDLYPVRFQCCYLVFGSSNVGSLEKDTSQ